MEIFFHLLFIVGVIAVAAVIVSDLRPMVERYFIDRHMVQERLRHDASTAKALRELAELDRATYHRITRDDRASPPC